MQNTDRAADDASTRDELLRVALVDDDRLMRRAATRTLQDFRVSPFDSAGAALAAPLDAGAVFDVVVTDLMMPGITGASLCAELARRFPHLCDRVIIMTGGATTPQTARFVEETTRPVVRKPFVVDHFIALVRDVGRGLR